MGCLKAIVTPKFWKSGEKRRKETKPFFYGEIRSLLQKQGQLIGSNDLLIASHALAEEAILITNNFSEFKRVKDLKIEIWNS